MVRRGKILLLALLIGLCGRIEATGIAQEFDAEQVFINEIKPLLVDYCYDCHGDGEQEGNLALDQFAEPSQALAKPEIWWQVLKNLRAGVMPPPDHSQLDPAERDKIFRWIKLGPFGIDPENPDPGPVTVRRLNRQEYGNTIRQLMGIPFDEKLIFPPDDTGHGFDTTADALMVSPLLMDKYLRAAELVVDRAVPQVTKIIPRQEFRGSDFRSRDSRQSGRWLDGKRPDVVRHSFSIDSPGTYDIEIVVKQHGSFEFDPARYRVTCQIDGQEKFVREFGWDENKPTQFEYQAKWEAGKHEMVFELEPIKPEESAEMLRENQGTHVNFQIDLVTVTGPEGTDKRVHPRNYTRFFHRDQPPEDAESRRVYAAEVLKEFATRAFRGPVADRTVERLVAIAEANYQRPEMTFEAGIGKAMIAVLVSPRFLFRIESTEPVDSDVAYAPIVERSLASRLSYFLWSSMPDDELLRLADEGKLRSQLSAQVDRMLADRRADAFISNFVGQWLRTRDVVQSTVNPEVVLGFDQEMSELRAWFREQFSGDRRGRRGERSPEDQARIDRFREIRGILEDYNDDLKRAMQAETEMFVEHVLKNDLSLLDLLDCNYTFLNERLARHYGIPGVQGDRMRKVELPETSPRGGVLTQASMLMVTSNPTRTSPVKRGLFVLENILGTPAPPAPAVVPELEESADRFGDREPTLRELLVAHRESALCASCHARMDPLGLALENFNALGQWRETDRGQPIEPQGVLVTGEAFDDVRSLKKLLREKRAHDFYRCVAEKMLVFAIGRGVEYTDEHTIDLIVQRLQKTDGKFSELVKAVVESAPFQMQRIKSDTAAPHPQP